MALCNVYDALCMPHPYKPRWSAQRAQAFLLEQSGQHFDPHLVQVIQGCFEQIEQYFESSKTAQGLRLQRWVFVAVSRQAEFT
ncbi:hypothetical protein [Pseudomonas mosselii]|uniref:hypothetical protein n=1 Tax=Pseudomonas mosselii TaxID=78327 RepID=UPI0034661311